MDVSDTGTFHVHVVPVDLEGITLEGDPRTEFWRFVSKRPRYENSNKYSDNEFEQMVQRQAGPSLKRQLVRYCDESLFENRYWPDERPQSRREQSNFEDIERALLGIFFEANITGYRSMDLAFDVTGISKLAKIFDDNFDLFEMFLRAFVPSAFSGSIDHYETDNRFRFEVEVPRPLRNAFESHAASSIPSPVSPTPQASGASLSQRTQWWLWLAANGSLLLPVLLALAVLYVAYDGIKLERESLRQAATELQTTAADISKDSQTRDAHLKSLETVLVKSALERLTGSSNAKSEAPSPQETSEHDTEQEGGSL